MDETSKNAWSRPEKWIGGGLLLIVLSIVIPVWVATDSNRRHAQARADIALMVSASERFFADYGHWPSPHMGMPNDMRYGRETGNELVMNILRAVDGPGNEGHRLNPSRIVFIELPRAGRRRSGLNADGAFIDPWGSPYQIVLDTDMNNTATMAHTAYPNQVGAGVVAWSYGSDRLPDTPQDVLSWRN